MALFHWNPTPYCRVAYIVFTYLTLILEISPATAAGTGVAAKLVATIPSSLPTLVAAGTGVAAKLVVTIASSLPTLVVVISPATVVGNGVVAKLVVIFSHPGRTTPPFSSAVGHILHAACGV